MPISNRRWKAAAAVIAILFFIVGVYIIGIVLGTDGMDIHLVH